MKLTQAERESLIDSSRSHMNGIDTSLFTRSDDFRDAVEQYWLDTIDNILLMKIATAAVDMIKTINGLEIEVGTQEGNAVAMLTKKVIVTALLKSLNKENEKQSI